MKPVGCRRRAFIDDEIASAVRHAMSYSESGRRKRRRGARQLRAMGERGFGRASAGRERWWRMVSPLQWVTRPIQASAAHACRRIGLGKAGW